MCYNFSNISRIIKAIFFGVTSLGFITFQLKSLIFQVPIYKRD